MTLSLAKLKEAIHSKITGNLDLIALEMLNLFKHVLN